LTTLSAVLRPTQKLVGFKVRHTVKVDALKAFLEGKRDPYGVLYLDMHKLKQQVIDEQAWERFLAAQVWTKTLMSLEKIVSKADEERGPSQPLSIPIEAAVYDTQTPTRHPETLMRPHTETPASTRVSLQNHSSSLTTGGAFKYPFSSKY
jgi:hypothetical protein